MPHRTARRRQTIPVGARIRRLRKERHLTQAVLASRIGVQQSDLCRMETGEYKVSLETLFKILGVFGIDIGDFFREDSSPQTPSDREAEAARLLRLLDERSQEEVLDYLRFRCSRRAEAEKA